MRGKKILASYMKKVGSCVCNFVFFSFTVHTHFSFFQMVGEGNGWDEATQKERKRTRPQSEVPSQKKNLLHFFFFLMFFSRSTTKKTFLTYEGYCVRGGRHGLGHSVEEHGER